MSFSGGSDDDAGGDEEESSSSSSLRDVDSLKSFREQWQRELTISPRHSPHPQAPRNQVWADRGERNRNDVDGFEDVSVETKAKNLFLQGIENERSGKLYEAIQFYRRAVQLVPDVEFRLYESTKPKLQSKIDSTEKATFERINDEVDEVEAEENVDIEENDCDILGRLSRAIEKNGYFCLPNAEQSTTHISALPMEIFFYVLQWVVSSELDIRSLEMISRVCRGFYVCTRDAEIWRMACLRVWGVSCGGYEPKYRSWREMYMERPRLRYNGCYISKTTYIRPGEHSFQDQYYKPWHLVEYCRYLRFFPEGKVLMLTCSSSDDAQSCVSSLKNRSPQKTSILVGHYRLHENSVSLVLKRQETKSATIYSNRRRRRGEVSHDSGEQTFHAEFEIQSYRKRPNSQLSWLCYVIYTKYKNGQEVPTKLSLGNKFPAFRFCRVKSYTQESEFPLQ